MYHYFKASNSARKTFADGLRQFERSYIFNVASRLHSTLGQRSHTNEIKINQLLSHNYAERTIYLCATKAHASARMSIDV